jgi:hypothetical protein
MKQGWTRLLDAARPGPRASRPRRRHAAAFFRQRNPLSRVQPAPTLDPVALTILAVNRLGPATVRTAANGRAVAVSVSDPRVGEIFRQALCEMQKNRTTDRLVEIIVANEDGVSADRR